MVEGLGPGEIIIPGETVIDLPAGSGAINYDYSISDLNLNILSNQAKSSLLAVSNLGKTTATVINSTLDLIRTFEDLETYILDGNLLNSLASGATSNSFLYPNTSNKFVKVIIILGSFNPIAITPKIKLKKNTNVYEVIIPTGNDQKRIEFNNIPITFVDSFQVENQTGNDFASYGNSILIQGL
jgi:hypothetical protein